MIDELGAEARELLEAARDRLGPDAAALRRVRAKVAIATGGAAVGGAAVGATLATKLGVVALAIAAATGAGWYVHARRGAPVAPVVAPALEVATAIERPSQVAAREPAVSDEALITIEAPDVPRPAIPRGPLPAASPVERGAHLASPRAAPSAIHGAAPAVHDAEVATPEGPARAPAASPPRAAELSREVELIDLAIAALGHGEPAVALRAVQQHAIETRGRGQLAEDAAAIEVEALCHLHDPSTAARLEAFDARFPRSAQRSRLTNRCP